MKKMICIILIVCTIFMLASCDNNDFPLEVKSDNGQPEAEMLPTHNEPLENELTDKKALEIPDEPDNWKIAIVTNDFMNGEEEFLSVDALVHKWGEDRIIHRAWPRQFAQEGEQMISIMQEIAADPEIRAVIITQAVINTNAAVDALLAMRDDMFVVYASIAEDPAEVAKRANLAFRLNDPLRGEVIVMQALEMGAETVAHMWFPRHMSIPSFVLRYDNMRHAAEREGINFVELIIPDPAGDGGGVQRTLQYINQDIPRKVEMLGSDTVLFATTCAVMLPLIRQVMAIGAMFVDVCCPSPYHRYPTAFGLEIFVPTGQYVEGEPIYRMLISRDLTLAMRDVIYAQGMTGRISTVPVSQSMLWTAMGVEYAMRWINNEVDKDIIDLDVLTEIGREFIWEETGEDAGVTLEMLDVDGYVYPNFILTLMDYILL
ncbi:MAG: DUF3798 domain-containing protein [Oscillospiraceae bacterium]|nr:DUF3798 domain-containing protein [Oscillospiraceae bacterium]